MEKTRTAKMVVCAMVCVLSWSAIAADEPSLGVDVSAAFMSKYIWRGQLLNDDYVMQPSVGLTYGNLSASLWGNVDMTEYHDGTHASGSRWDNQWEFTEYDWTIDYSSTVPGVDILSYSVGMIYYYFPSTSNDLNDTIEVYVGLGLDTVLSPTVTVYRDIDEADGTYVAFSVSHSIEKICELSPDMPVGMDISASVGWGSEGYNNFYWPCFDGTKVNSSSLQDLTLSVGFPIPVLGWTVTPSVSYVTLLDSDLRKADTFSNGNLTDKKGSDYFFTGLTVSRSF